MELAGYDVMALIPLALGLVVTGIVAGILAGLLGVGGGIVIVPVLYYVFTVLGIDEAIRMHLAVGTSLGTIILTSIRSVRAHHKRGAVDWALLRSWALPILFGVVVGTLTAAYVSGRTLEAVFATVALIVAANMAFGRESWKLGESLPAYPFQAAIAWVIGLLSAMMGIGGGTFGVTVLTLYGRTAQQAVATSAGLGLLISVPGALGFVASGWGEPGLPPGSLGYLNFVGLILIVPLTVLAAPWGANLAHAISHTALKRAFALFLAITSIRMFYGIFWG